MKIISHSYSSGEIFHYRVGTIWCPLGASEPSIVFLNGSNLERECVGMGGKRMFQSETSKNILDGSDVPRGYT